MATFRNNDTGKEFTVSDRHAATMRRLSHVSELTPEGSPIPSEPSPVAESDPALKTLRLADLRALAAERGLSDEGTKAELVARLSGAAE